MIRDITDMRIRKSQIEQIEAIDWPQCPFCITVMAAMIAKHNEKKIFYRHTLNPDNLSRLADVCTEELRPPTHFSEFRI